MDRGFNVALISLMQDKIVKGIREKEAECNVLAEKAGDALTQKLAQISMVMGLKEAEVIVLKVAKKLLEQENNDLVNEMTERIKKALAES